MAAPFVQVFKELEVTGEYQGYIVTSRDYYEYTESMIKTFIERVQAAITGDATISNWLDRCVVVADRTLARRYINAHLSKNLIVIHSFFEEPDAELRGPMRQNYQLHATISCIGRSGKELDANYREIPLLGDGTATQPGVYEMQNDVRTVLDRNTLASGGVDYVWDL